MTELGHRKQVHRTGQSVWILRPWFHGMTSSLKVLTLCGRQAEVAMAAERADAAAEAAMATSKEAERHKRAAERKLVRLTPPRSCAALPLLKLR